MKFILQPIFNAIEAKPLLGYAVLGQGVLSSILVYLKMLTPIIGFTSAVVGLAAAIITFKIKWREWKQGSKS